MARTNHLDIELNNKNLAIGDYVQIHVIDKRINQNDSQIKVIGKLLDYPTEDEINTYYGNQIINIV